MTYKLKFISSNAFFLLCALLIHLVLLANMKFTLWPEMVVYPYLLNNDFIPYKDLVQPYPPLFLYALRLFSSIFNYSVESYKMLTWAIILILDLLIFSFSHGLSKSSNFARISLLFFLVISIPFSINGLWFDLVQAPLLLSSVYFFIRFIKEKNYYHLNISLFLLILAAFVKQQALWLFPAYMLVLLFFTKNPTTILKKLNLAYFTFAFLALFHLVIILKLNILKEFIEWVVIFPALKTTSTPGYISLPTSWQAILIIATFITFLPIALFGKQKEKVLLICASFLLLFTLPRFDFFHLVPSVSVLSLIIGPNMRLLLKSKNTYKILPTLSLALLCLFTYRTYMIDWQKQTRFFESDIYASATLISMITNPQDRIYIQNGPDQLLVLSKRLPPKPWLDEFPWYLEGNSYQKNVVTGIVNEDVKFVVYKPYENNGKYALGSYIPYEINDHIINNYKDLLQLSESLWLKSKL